MNFTIDIESAHRNEILNTAEPGDEVTIRAFVQRVSVDALDITQLGKPRQLIQGAKEIQLVVVEVVR